MLGYIFEHLKLPLALLGRVFISSEVSMYFKYFFSKAAQNLGGMRQDFCHDISQPITFCPSKWQLEMLTFSSNNV